jgi:hypothetical protein
MGAATKLLRSRNSNGLPIRVRLPQTGSFEVSITMAAGLADMGARDYNGLQTHTAQNL